MQTFVEENENIILYFCALDGEKVPVEIASNATVTQLRVCMRSRHSPAELLRIRSSRSHLAPVSTMTTPSPSACTCCACIFPIVVSYAYQYYVLPAQSSQLLMHMLWIRRSSCSTAAKQSLIGKHPMRQKSRRHKSNSMWTKCVCVCVCVFVYEHFFFAVCVAYYVCLCFCVIGIGISCCLFSGCIYTTHTHAPHTQDAPPGVCPVKNNPQPIHGARDCGQTSDGARESGGGGGLSRSEGGRLSWSSWREARDRSIAC
jgi:hypothetical protein